MKESFSRFLLHVVWKRKRDLYYAVSIISIAGNFIVLVGPTVQACILSLGSILKTIELLQTTASSSFGSLQAALQTACAVGALQIRSWNTSFPQVAELVLQRSVLCILLNLIVARIVFKSGVLGCKKSSQMPFYVKQEEFCSVANFFVCGSHWLAPSYLHTLCSTMSNFPDVPVTTASLLQHAHHYHSKETVTMTDTSLAIIPVSALLCDQYEQNDAFTDEIAASNMIAAAVVPSPVPSRPSLFIIEPLDELVPSVTPPKPSVSDYQVPSRHPLQKVATKMNLLEEDSRSISDTLDYHQSPVQRIKDRHDIMTKQQTMVLAIEHGNIRHRCRETKVELVNETILHDDDNLLSSQDFNKRVDTFISKFKRNLTMQRQDSLNRLLGLY